MARRRNNTPPPLRFDKKLILNQWLLHLFECDTFEKLAEDLKDTALETLDENNISRFHQAIVTRLFNLAELPPDVLLGYDQNIVRHTLAISTHRQAAIRWKYFQYLTLLFTEIYLDRFFRNADKLLADLNDFLARLNAGKAARDQVSAFEMSDLNKLAFWNATGSGKTLIMHVNIKQYQHYLDMHDQRRSLNRVILLTPNEGLSRQHLDEFEASGIGAELFSKDGRGLFSGRNVEVIDIHKLKDEMGDKTVAVESFESNNLVLVDEGHRGAGGTEWKSKRDQLCEEGFSFEYSATFGQAIRAARNNELEQEYAKCILFDYSYKYFYKDGFGKDYRILNLAEDDDEEVRTLYLTACLLAFYQQQVLFEEHTDEFRPFLLEKPLWVFVGGSVKAVRTQNRRKVSDVLDVLLTLAEFVGDKRQSVDLLDRLMSGEAGLLDTNGQEIFSNSFSYLIRSGRRGDDIFADIVRRLFNADSAASIHVENLKGTDGEIALRLGDNDPFGVVNVGDASSLCKLCENRDGLEISEKEFSSSLFDGINDSDSTVNILIGSKKFTEGWNSWRVSTMGLMNIGRTEGSEIIQLFGRGVRLKGYGFSLKRSRRVSEVRSPDNIDLLETLNIFGIRADYMRQFKEYLEEEGLPSNEDRIEFVLPVVQNLGAKRLKMLRLKEGLDFKRNGPKPSFDMPDDHLRRHRVVLDWYPKIQAQQSKGVQAGQDEGVRHTGQFDAQHIAFMDMDAIFFDLERFKAERAWHNLNLPRDRVRMLLESPDWYTLYIPPEEMSFRSFRQVRRWEEIAAALLKKYADRFYKYYRDAWERQHLEYRELSLDDPNFIEEYRVLLEQSRTDIVTTLEELRAIIGSGALQDFECANLNAYFFGQHLYQPLLFLKNSSIQISPVTLNAGERDFVVDLRRFHDRQRQFFQGKELYLLRNMSRGRGIGFFEAGNFHPDFILWLLADQKQYVSFVDPKGIRNLEGPNDPKIRFHETIKEIEARLGDPVVILNSFIISNTSLRDVSWWSDGMTKAEFEDRNVVFQEEDKDTYIKTILTKSLASESAATA